MTTVYDNLLFMCRDVIARKVAVHVHLLYNIFDTFFFVRRCRHRHHRRCVLFLFCMRVCMGVNVKPQNFDSIPKNKYIFHHSHMSLLSLKRNLYGTFFISIILIAH